MLRAQGLEFADRLDGLLAGTATVVGNGLFIISADIELLAVATVLAAMFPASQLKIYPYHRVLMDLDGADVQGFLADVSAAFSVHPGRNCVKNSGNHSIRPDRPMIMTPQKTAR